MIYLLYGTNYFLIKREIEKIKLENNIESIDINNYNLENTILDNILDDALTLSLFSQKKMIIVDNSYIFTPSVRKKGLDHNMDLLNKYIENPNPDTILIFVINEEKIDDRKKIVKLIKINGNVIEFNEIKNIDTFIKNELNDYKMDAVTINSFVNRVGDNLAIIASEIEKLKLYKNDDKIITKEDVFNVCSEQIDVDMNELTNSIVSKNISKSLKIYNELINQGEEPLQIIIRLANQFRIIYQSKELTKKGYSNKDIADILGIHPYRVKKALEISYKFPSKELLSILKKLSRIDEGIKMGNMDKNIALEQFILEI